MALTYNYDIIFEKHETYEYMIHQMLLFKDATKWTKATF